MTSKRGFSATLGEVAGWSSAHIQTIGGSVSDMGSQEVCGVAVDSRELVTGDLYIARRGLELDGHNFVPQVAVGGAVAAVVDSSGLDMLVHRQESCSEPLSNFPLLVVADVDHALRQIAKGWRRKLKCPVIAVTGSVGKTSAKEMLRCCMTEVFGEGVASIKSYNNHVGLPLTVLSADADEKWMVLEAGMNHAGELALLSSVAEPDIVLILNVGPVHLEFFRDIDAIADAKCELVECLRDGFVVLNGDDTVLNKGFDRLQERVGFEYPKVKFGRGGSCDYKLVENRYLGENGSQFSFENRGRRYIGQIGVPGQHQVSNALAALSVVFEMIEREVRGAIPGPALDGLPGDSLPGDGGDLKDCLKQRALVGLSHFRAVDQRAVVRSFGNLTVVDDTYNANPLSMRASIDLAVELARRGAGRAKVISILGDMLEIGERSEEEHRTLGSYVAQSGVDHLVAVGDFAQDLCQGARSEGIISADAVLSVEEAVAKVQMLLRSADLDSRNSEQVVVQIKGSRGMKLEKAVKMLEQG